MQVIIAVHALFGPDLPLPQCREWPRCIEMGTTSCFVSSIADHRADDDRIAACPNELPGYLHFP